MLNEKKIVKPDPVNSRRIFLELLRLGEVRDAAGDVRAGVAKGLNGRLGRAGRRGGLDRARGGGSHAVSDRIGSPDDSNGVVVLDEDLTAAVAGGVTGELHDWILTAVALDITHGVERGGEVAEQNVAGGIGELATVSKVKYIVIGVAERIAVVIAHGTVAEDLHDVAMRIADIAGDGIADEVAVEVEQKTALVITGDAADVVADVIAHAVANGASRLVTDADLQAIALVVERAE